MAMRSHVGLLRQDFTYAIRDLVRVPAFTAPALLALALGIAVNSATFSVVSALLFRPLGPSAGGELIRIGRSVRGDGSFRSASPLDLLDLRRHASTLSYVFGQHLQPLTIGGREAAEVVSGEAVTGNYFQALGVVAAHGRGLSMDDEHSTGGPAVAVISDGLWRRRFGGDPRVIGRPITLNTFPCTIVGVAPPRFLGTFPGVSVDVWIPFTTGAIAEVGDATVDPPRLMLMGRLRPGVSSAGAAAELDALALQIARDDPARGRDRGLVVAIARGAHPLIARIVRTFLLLLMAIVAVVLLMACANVASLLLARATARRSELAVRLALGAGRSRIITQLLVESLVLALLGGAAGLLLAYAAMRGVNAMALLPGPTGAPVFLDLSVDGRVLGFTAGAAVLTSLVFGLAPALQATRVDLATALTGARSSFGRQRSRLRSALIVGQVALSATLLVSAVLLSRSLRRAASLDPGFDPGGVIVASFNLELPGYDRSRVQAFFDELLRRTRLLPGVERAALADFVPMGDRGGSVGLTTTGRTPPLGEDGVQAAYNRVSEDYFVTIRQPLVGGREFTDRDRSGSLPVAIVNEAMARRFWPDEEALGKRLRLEGEPSDRRVIGVAANARFASFGGEIRPLVFLPTRQREGMHLALHVRSSLPAARVLSDVRRLAREIDPHVAVQRATTMRASMAFSLFPAVVARSVLAIAGIIGLLLASSGLYGLVSYTLEQRVREIGVRVALGASRSQVLREIAGSAFRLASIGLAMGLGLALAAMRLFSAWLYGISPADPLTFAATAIVLLSVVLAASYAAARKALNVDPIVALRHD